MPEPDLERGETMLWSGAPPQGPILRAGDFFLVPFSLIWGGGVLWTFVRMPNNGQLPLFTVLFVTMAAYITVGRFILDAWIRSRTAYAVTSDRVIITSGILSRTEKSLNIRTLTDVTLEDRSDGRGTITFGPVPRQVAIMRGMQWPGMPQVPMFERIPDAKGVYHTIRDAQRRAAAPA